MEVGKKKLISIYALKKMTIERTDRITRIEYYSRARIGFVSICIVSALATVSTLASYHFSFALAPAEASRSLNENKPARTINLSAAGTLSYHALKRKKQQEKQSSKNLYSQVMKPSSSSEGLSYRELKRKQQMDLSSNRISTEIIDRYDDDETITNNDDEVTLFGRSRGEPAKAYRLGTWPRTTPLPQLVEGPAAPYQNGSLQLVFPYASETDAVCHFEQKGSWDHFLPFHATIV